MLTLMIRNWWAVALRGVLAILFGVVAWAWPGLTLGALVILFGAFAFADGVVNLAHAFYRSAAGPRWLLIAKGVAGVAVGLLTIVWPGLTALGLLYFIAAWAILIGVGEIVAAVQLRRQIQNEWMLGLSGLASLVVGLILLIAPGDGALGLIWLIGLYAIIFGVLLIALGVRLRRLGPGREAPSADGTPRTV